LKWKFPVSQGVSITPGLSKDGKIYFGDWGGVFYALDLNGQELWRIQTPPAYETLSSSPAIGADGTVYFGAIAEYFYAYTPEGKEKWKINVGEAGIASSPAIGADGTVYFVTVRGLLYALGTGKITSDQITPSQPAVNESNKRSRNSPATVLAVAAIILCVMGTALFLPLLIKRKTLQGKAFAIYTLAVKYRLVVILVYTLLLAVAVLLVLAGSPKNQPVPKSTTSPQSQINPQNVDKTSVCPRRVYGHSSTGYYGVYEMQQIDMTDEEYQWARKNCRDTVWTDN
jgi:hypothetical protein